MSGRAAKRRRAAAAAAGAVVVGAAGVALPSGAAFVDPVATSQPVGADTVTRWLGLEAPAAASCAAPAGTAATGADAGLALAVGGPPTAAGRTLDCAFVVRARATLPEGVARITVGVDRDDPAASPLTGASLTGLDGAGPAATAELDPGERAAVRLTVLDRDAARGYLSLVVSFTGETSGFLRYRVPVDVCAGALAASCVPTPPSTPGDGAPGTPDGAPGGTGTQSGAAPNGAGATGQAGSGASGAADSTSRRQCVSRRTITLRLKRTWGTPRGVRVTLHGKTLRIRRSGSRVTARIDLRGRRRERVTVRITATTAAGRRVTDTRRYWTCTPKAVKR